jgi:hypothetical protein
LTNRPEIDFYLTSDYEELIRTVGELSGVGEDRMKDIIQKAIMFKMTISASKEIEEIIYCELMIICSKIRESRFDTGLGDEKVQKAKTRKLRNHGRRHKK